MLRGDLRLQEQGREGGEPLPAKLLWFPLTKGRGAYTHAVMGMDQQYPYPAKIVISYFMDAIANVPGGQRYIETFMDPERVPLHIAVMTQYGGQTRFAHRSWLPLGTRSASKSS